MAKFTGEGALCASIYLLTTSFIYWKCFLGTHNEDVHASIAERTKWNMIEAAFLRSLVFFHKHQLDSREYGIYWFPYNVQSVLCYFFMIICRSELILQCSSSLQHSTLPSLKSFIFLSDCKNPFIVAVMCWPPFKNRQSQTYGPSRNYTINSTNK